MSSSSVEDLVDLVASLPRARDEVRVAQEVVSARLYLAVNRHDQPELFVRGDLESFGEFDHSPVLEWDEYLLSEARMAMPALVIRSSSGPHGQRIMAHLAYEALRLIEESPELDNEQLVNGLQPFLRLALSETMLGAEAQIGLAGELQFLRELLDLCTDSELQNSALSAWVGPAGARRDFFQDGLAVEVKAGGGLRHQVGYEQMLSSSGTELLLASVRVHRDPSASLKLPDLVDRIEGMLLSSATVSDFYTRLAEYGEAGYHRQLAGHYRLSSGFFIDPVELRRIDRNSPILQPTSFRRGQPDAAVSGIHYYLDVTGIPPLPASEKLEVLSALVGLQPG